MVKSEKILDVDGKDGFALQSCLTVSHEMRRQEAGGNVLSSDKVLTHALVLNTLHLDFYFAVKHLNVIYLETTVTL